MKFPLDQSYSQVVYYESEPFGLYRAPRLVAHCSVSRETKSQLLVSTPNGGVKRFRRDTGRLVGGSYRSPYIKPLFSETAQDVIESELRLSAYQTLMAMEKAHASLQEHYRKANIPITQLRHLAPKLEEIRKAIEALDYKVKG